MNINLLNLKNPLIEKSCTIDTDCRTLPIADFNSLFCVDNKCKTLKLPGSNCSSPSECSSYSFYGPLACSEKCKNGKACHSNFIENTPFCCRNVPMERDCSVDRPGGLSGCNSNAICSVENGKPICIDKKEKSWLLGMLLSIFGNVFINIGVNLMKRSYHQNYINVYFFKMPLMLLGELVYILGKVTSYSAYIFGNQSMLAGLSATGLVSNSFFAPIINNEVFTWKDATAILLVFIGSSFIISNTSKTHVVYTLCELLSMYYRPATIMWFGFIIIVIIVMYIFIKYVEVNSDWGLADDSLQILHTDTHYFEEDGFICKYVMVVAYVALSSFIAAYSTLSAKSLGEIIDKTLGGDNQFRYIISYFFISSLILCTIGQIYWLNRALKHFDALLVIPIFHIFWTFLSILSAGIYFQDFDHYSYKQLKNFIIGVGIIFCGSIFLGLRTLNQNTVNTREIYIPNEQYDEDE